MSNTIMISTRIKDVNNNISLSMLSKIKYNYIKSYVYNTFILH